MTMYDLRGDRKYLNWEERGAFFDAAMNLNDLMEKTFCMALFFTGCRISEALELTGRRVDFTEKSIVLRTLKQRAPGVFRAIPIPMGLVRLLDDLVMEKETQNDRLFEFSRSTAYRMIKKVMLSAGITGPQASPKGLRHSYAVACLLRGVPVTTVQIWLGHRRLKTTAIYLKIAGELERDLAKKVWRSSWTIWQIILPIARFFGFKRALKHFG